jgi:hypothetical protein
MRSRPFGAGFGIGIEIVSAEQGAVAATIDAAISNASPQPTAGIADDLAIRRVGFLVNTSSCQAFSHFIVFSARGATVFP